MTPIGQLRVALCHSFEELRGGRLNADIARAIAHMAGKIIESCKVELEYAHLRQVKPRIVYLDEEQ